jgi:outer membrane protein TolC
MKYLSVEQAAGLHRQALAQAEAALLQARINLAQAEAAMHAIEAECGVALPAGPVPDAADDRPADGPAAPATQVNGRPVPVA